MFDRVPGNEAMKMFTCSSAIHTHKSLIHNMYDNGSHRDATHINFYAYIIGKLLIGLNQVFEQLKLQMLVLKELIDAIALPLLTSNYYTAALAISLTCWKTKTLLK